MKPHLTAMGTTSPLDDGDEWAALVHRHLRSDEIVREGDALAAWATTSLAGMEAHLKKARADLARLTSPVS